MSNDTCEIRFVPTAFKALQKVGRVDPYRLPFIEGLIENISDNGWILSVHGGAIKVLDQRRQVGEIRDLGSGGYRLFFFWFDGPGARVLVITALEKKSRLKGKSRVNEFIDAADALRRRYSGQEEEE